MTRRYAPIFLLALLPLAMAGPAAAQSIDTFGVLAGQSITNTGTGTLIDGNIGLSPNGQSSITGFVPIEVTGTIYAADDTGANAGVAAQAKTDLSNLYTLEHGQSPTEDLSGQDLGNRTLMPGVYTFSSSAQLTGTLTLDGLNSTTPFVFIINSGLTTAADSAITLIHGALGSNVYFVVGSSATLGARTAFAGRILAQQTITLGADANINCGGALAETGSVTLDTNFISSVAASVCMTAVDTFTTVLGPDATANERAVAAALDALIGPLPAAFTPLLTSLTPAELDAAFAQLSGEAGGGAATAGGQSMDSFLSTVLDSTDTESGGPAGAGPENGPAPVTVKTLDYNSERLPSPSEVAAISFAGPPPSPDTGRWIIWGQAYGGGSNITGDAGVGTHDLSTTDYGLAGGFGRQVTPDTKVGFALSAGTASFNLAGGLGGGNSQIIQAAIDSRSNFGRAYVATVLAYGYDSVSTTRHVVIGAPLAINDTYTAAYAAQDVAAEIETGYHLRWLTPYAAVRVGAFFTPAYSESGPGDFGLAYAARTTLSVRSELGARFAHVIAMHDGATWTLKASAAWAHDYIAPSDVTTAFEEIPTSPFSVSSASAAADWLLASVGTEYTFRNGFAVGATADGAFAANAQTWSGKAQISYRW